MSPFPSFPSLLSNHIVPDHSSDEVMACDVLSSPLIPFFLFFFFQSSGSRWNSIGMVEDAAKRSAKHGVGVYFANSLPNVEEDLFMRLRRELLCCPWLYRKKNPYELS